MKDEPKPTATVWGIERVLAERRVYREQKTGTPAFCCEAFERIKRDTADSAANHRGFITFESTAGFVTNVDLRRGRSVDVVTLKKPKVISETDDNGNAFELTAKWEAHVFNGDRKAEHLDKVFFVAELPPEVAKVRGKNGKAQALATFLCDFMEQEDREFQRAAEEKRAAHQKEVNPRGLPEPTAEDHKKRQEALERLLRNQWPRFSKANDKLRATTEESEREQLKREVFHGYLADYKALTGTNAQVSEPEKDQLLSEDNYVVQMADAIASHGSQLDKLNWELATGWFYKGYCYMTASEIELAIHGKRSGHSEITGKDIAQRATRDLGLPRLAPKGRPKKLTQGKRKRRKS